MADTVVEAFVHKDVSSFPVHDKTTSVPDHPLVKALLPQAGANFRTVYIQEAVLIPGNTAPAGSDSNAVGIPFTAPASVQLSTIIPDEIATCFVAVAHNFTITFSPLSGLLGHPVDLHYGWGSANMPLPNTFAKFNKLAGRSVLSFGGVTTGGISTTVLPIHTALITPVIKSNLSFSTGEAILYYYLDVQTYGVPARGNLFMLLISANVELYGPL